MVKKELTAGAVGSTARVRFALPPVMMVAWLNVAVTPVGSPLTVRLTLPVRPFWVILILACSADRIVSVPADGVSRTVSVAVGQELRITLGNVGPAEYESPPQISSSALTFLAVDVIPPYTPAGATQQFRFQAVSAGQTIVHFRRLRGDSVVGFVEDTVQIH